MSGSSLRNVVHRRNHKERSQPVQRAKYGLLEKHKDYIQRARDHNLKRDRIKRLREIAALRNKDEFNFGMIRSRTVNGVHIQDRGNEALENDVVALLKTQDAGYVRAQIMAEKKRITALTERIAPAVPTLSTEWLEAKEERKETLQKAGLLVADPLDKKKGKQKAFDFYDFDFDEEEEEQNTGLIGGQGKKTVWADDVDQVRSYQPSSLQDADKAAGTTRQGQNHLGYLVTELASRQDRLEKLSSAAEKLGIVRALMTTKGQSARKQKDRKDTLTDAVIAGKVTSNGLALPGNEDEDEDDGGASGSKRKPKVFRWSKERKR